MTYLVTAVQCLQRSLDAVTIAIQHGNLQEHDAVIGGLDGARAILIAGEYKMDLIIELILQLAFACADEGMKCRKIPKSIRYALLLIIVLTFFAVIALLVFTGVLLFNKNTIFSLLLIFLAIFMTIFIVNKVGKAVVMFKKDNVIN